MPSSLEKRRDSDIKDAGGTKKLLNLSLKLYRAEGWALFSAPSLARTPEEWGRRINGWKSESPSKCIQEGSR
jgi:hypothetical protein